MIGFWTNYSVLNVPRNETRYFDVSEFIKPDKVVVYTRDQYGLRGDYGSNPANIDVLVIGGSTTNERFLDDRETWVAQLQEQFKAAGDDLVVTNAAIDGQSTRGHIKAFDLWSPKYQSLNLSMLLAIWESTMWRWARALTSLMKCNLRMFLDECANTL